MVSGAFLTIDCLTGKSARSLRCRLLSEQGQSVIASGHHWIAVDGAGDETPLDVTIDSQEQFPYGVDIPDTLPVDAVILVASDTAGANGEIEIAAGASIEQILTEAAVPLEERTGRASLITKSEEDPTAVDIREVATINPVKQLDSAKSENSNVDEDRSDSEYDNDDHNNGETDHADGERGLKQRGAKEAKGAKYFPQMPGRRLGH